MSKLVGMVGKKGSGKDTVAGMLLVQHGFVARAFAEQLKSICFDLFRLSESQLYGSLAYKEEIDPRWGMSAREIMQKIGTEVGRQGKFDVFEPVMSAGIVESEFNRRGLVPCETLWVDDIVRTIRERRKAARGQVVTDCRFQNEADAIKRERGVVVRVIRPGLATGHREEHASEMEQEAIIADYEIMNDGSLEQLREKVDKMVFELWEYV